MQNAIFGLRLAIKSMYYGCLVSVLAVHGGNHWDRRMYRNWIIWYVDAYCMKCSECPISGDECVGLEVPRFCVLIDPANEAYDPRYREAIASETERRQKQKYPTLATQARNLFREIAAFVRSGGKLASKALRRARLAKCEEPCEKWDAAQRRCRACGCKGNAKVYSLLAKCPLNKWPTLPDQVP